MSVHYNFFTKMFNIWLFQSAQVDHINEHYRRLAYCPITVNLHFKCSTIYNKIHT